jgi:hypothetical protein
MLLSLGEPAAASAVEQMTGKPSKVPPRAETPGKAQTSALPRLVANAFAVARDLIQAAVCKSIPAEMSTAIR